MENNDQELKKTRIWIPLVIILTGLLILATLWGVSFSKSRSKSKQSEVYHKLDLQIKGMVCSACKENIENSLAGLSGVIKVYADPKTNSGWVIYDPQKISQSEILKTNIFSVYPAKVIRDKPYKKRNKS